MAHRPGFAFVALILMAGCRQSSKPNLPEVTLRVSPKPLAKYDYSISESFETSQSKSTEQREAKFRLGVTAHTPGRIDFDSHGLDDRNSDHVKIAVDPFGMRLGGDTSKTLLGPPFPKEPVHLSSTWTEPVEDLDVIGAPLPTPGPTGITYTVTALSGTSVSIEGDIEFAPVDTKSIEGMEVHVSEDIDPRDGMPIRYVSTLKVWGRTQNDISAATLSVTRI